MIIYLKLVVKILKFIMTRQILICDDPHFLIKFSEWNENKNKLNRVRNMTGFWQDNNILCRGIFFYCVGERK